ncbi:hypothetical protein YK48G_12850 [Lentilactobacillus fungorum]|uniref:Fido domain-containing protein n=1 Tax=Lentilactobacillus fungorum TaxID=2201250 RepID=A0ABQ3VZ65_9LACO|nr:cell filamentation protein Fic [Lentilactobacillus fungorum]GHP13860.1 hypothetical protein YK48G_12850 [Lentilactobacillus fungorum]
MDFLDKVTMTHKDNQKLAIKEMINLVYSMSQLAGGRATRQETETIVLGSDVYGLSVADTQLIRRLQRAVELVIRSDQQPSGELLAKMNGLIVSGGPLKSSGLRKMPTKIVGTDHVISAPDEARVDQELQTILAANDSSTFKALKVILYVMGQQLYAAENTVTAFLFANYLLVHGGAGLITITDSALPTFHRLAMAYYSTGNGEPLIKWLYEHCIISD